VLCWVAWLTAALASGRDGVRDDENRGGPWLAVREDVGTWAGLGIGKWAGPKKKWCPFYLNQFSKLI
jgi:hypothetical protein